MTIRRFGQSGHFGHIKTGESVWPLASHLWSDKKRVTRGNVTSGHDNKLGQVLTVNKNWCLCGGGRDHPWTDKTGVMCQHVFVEEHQITRLHRKQKCRTELFKDYFKKFGFCHNRHLRTSPLTRSIYWGHFVCLSKNYNDHDHPIMKIMISIALVLLHLTTTQI